MKLKVKEEVGTFGWNKKLLTPLVVGEIVELCEDQSIVTDKTRYFLVEHGPEGAKTKSIFNLNYFTKL